MGVTLARWLAAGLDWPQAWTAAAVLLVAALGWLGLPPGFGQWGPGLAVAYMALAVWLIASAVLAMRRAHTTVNPRGQPAALVTGGVFAISRNPIYLGDLLLILAAAFWWDTAWGLLVAGGFLWVATDRFIRVEEERLAEIFGDEAALWFNRTRRWI